MSILIKNNALATIVFSTLLTAILPIDANAESTYKISAVEAGAKAAADNSLETTERLIVAGEFDKAKHALNSLTSTDKNKLEWQLLQARLLMGSNQLDQANDKIQSLIKQYPNYPQVHYWFARINGNLAQQASIFKAGSYAKKSKNAFIKSIEVDPNYVEGYQGLIQFYLRAPAIAGGSIKKATKTAKELLKVNPLQGQLSLLSIAQDEDDDEWEAEVIRTLKTDYPNKAAAQFVVGFHYQAKEQFEQAYQAFKQALSPESDGGNDISEGERSAKLSAMYQLGRNAVFSNLHIEDGINALQQYLDEEVPTTLPSKRWAKYRLSKLYLMNKQKALAKPLLISLNDKKYDDDLVELVQKELKSL